jgi:GAF domain-containing protein
LFEAERPGLVIIDDDLPGAGGPALSRNLRALANGQGADLPIMIVGRKASPNGAGLEDATDWIQAPFSAEFARARIRTWMMRGKFAGSAPPSPRRGRTPCRAALAQPARHGAGGALRPVHAAHGGLVRRAGVAGQPGRRESAMVQILPRHRAVRDFARAVILRARLGWSDVLLVPDALLDPRFADNPLVIDGPRIRFYAGAPLRVGGLAVGTLCVLDVRPRIMSEREIGLLRDMAALVEKELTPQLIARPALASMTG